MTEEIDGNITLTQKVTGVWFNLVTPKVVGKKGKDKKFSGSFLFAPDHQDIQQIKDTIVAVARAEWPDKPLSEMKFPIEDGDKLFARKTTEGKNYPFVQGKSVLVARKPEKNPPQISILEGGKFKELEGEARAIADEKFYGGCQVLLRLQFKAYDAPEGGKDGITCYLNQVVWVADGERLGGRSTAETFSGYVGSTSQEDPTVGATDTEEEIPF